MRTVFVILILSALSVISSYGSDRLLYFEAQGVAGYSKQQDDVIFHSKSEEDVMQKSSVGFDYIQRLSGETKDIGTVAVQCRLAYDPDAEDKLEPQLYNAYFKYKAGWADIWLGHNRPALGLSSYFDSHALLLTTLAMNGFGFDRDWGIGASRDFSWGNAAISLTTGSGMPIYFKGNYLVSARVSKGFLNQDNYSLGFSASRGVTLDAMGYELMHGDPMTFSAAGADFSYLWDNFEARFEAMGGKNHDDDAYALFLRIGVNLLEESRLKLEIQPMFSKIGDDERFQFSAGPTFALTDNLTLRAMYEYDQLSDNHRVVFQAYYYRKL